ncbi:MAG: MauE/DoxX family redox-associated membrane protein [Candidatus Dormibacteraceae bacterium]
MIADIFALQPLVVGLVFCSTGLSKLMAPRSGDLIANSALVSLFGLGAARAIYRVVAVIEILLAVLLLVGPERIWVTRAASALAVSFVVYLLISLKVAPGRPCGCFGGSESPISWRTLSRAGFVCAFSVLAWPARESWLATLVSDPWYLGIVGAQLVLLAAISPEFIRGKLATTHQAMPKTSFPLGDEDCGSAQVPLSESLNQLRASAMYSSHSAFLRSDMIEHWREGCWRFLSFGARYEGRKVTAVFAVPVMYQPDRIRVALVDETDGTVLLAKGPAKMPPKAFGNA